jgi:GntR family transcriptional regulator
MAKKKLRSFSDNISGDPIPVYFKLQKQLLDEIEGGRWAPGERIPPERVLAESYHISIGTVKKAVLNLVNEGYLYRIQGKGTFVAGMTLQPQSLRYYRFIKKFEAKEAELQIKLLELAESAPIAPINRLLKLRFNQNLYEIKRFFLFRDNPVVYCVSYLPRKMFAKLDKLPRHQFEKIPLYLALQENYGLPTIFNRELFSSVCADKAVAARFGVPKNTPVLRIEMLSFTYRQTPYEYRQSYCRTDKRAIFREI